MSDKTALTTMSRALAFVIDGAILFFVWVLLELAGAIFDFHVSELLLSLIAMGYFIGMTWQFGGTFGKLNTKLRVVGIDGAAINLWQATRRMAFYWLYIISSFLINQLVFRNTWHPGNHESWSELNEVLSGFGALAYFSLLFALWLVDHLAIFSRTDKRTWHDVVAGTKVVKLI